MSAWAPMTPHPHPRTPMPCPQKDSRSPAFQVKLVGLGECVAIIILLSSVVKQHQKIYFYIEDASILAVHALDLLCNQGNNSSLVVSIVETFETHFTSDFCLLEQQSMRDSVAVKYGGRVGGSVFALPRASTKVSSRVSKYSSCSSRWLFGLVNGRLCSVYAGAFVQEEMLAFINSIRFLCVVFDFTKSPT